MFRVWALVFGVTIGGSTRADDLVKITIEPDRPLHSISPYIYGVSAMPVDRALEAGVTALRWGGNRTSRYNWKSRADNAGSDWFFLNGKAGNWVDDVTKQNKAKIASYVTVPMLPWIAKGADGSGFSVAKYGAQQKVEPYVADRGNGLKPEGTPITGNDPRDTSVESTPVLQAEGIKLLPKAARGLPRVYGLDNEPMLWSHTHRDVHPIPSGYDEIFTRGRDYARAIKKADPSALVAGPVTWGWTDLNFSALDEGKDRYATHADNRAHEGLPFAAWYLREMQKASTADGKPLIDLLDVHIYPQGQADGQPIFNGKTPSDAMRALRIRSTRGLWDPNYKDESWINEPIKLIPRCREWIEAYNPGLGVCLGEYSWGGDDDISGAIAQAEVLGIFAREQVDHAYFWAGMGGVQKLAMKLYRNPRGKGPGFGETYLACQSSDPERVSIFAARRKLDKATTLILINKDIKAKVDVQLTGIGQSRPRTANLTRVESNPPKLSLSKQAIDAAITSLRLPPLSATLLEVPGPG